MQSWAVTMTTARKPAVISTYFTLCMHVCIYIYINICSSIWFTNCVLLSDDNSSIPGCL